VKNKLNAEYVDDVSKWDSGGGVTLDIVTLKSGKVIGISEEVVTLYENLEDLVTGQVHERPSILLCR
jgi:hypothetical protein